MYHHNNEGVIKVYFPYGLCDCSNYWLANDGLPTYNDWGYIGANEIPLATMTVNYRPCQKDDTQSACYKYSGQKFRASQNFSVPETGNPIISLRFQLPSNILVDVAEDRRPFKSDYTVAFDVSNGYIFRDPNNKKLNGRNYYFGHPQNATAPFTITIYGNYQ